MKRALLYLSVVFLFLTAAQTAFSFTPKVIRAKACIILDTDDSVLFSKNASVKLAPASTVKLMTAMVALDHLLPEAIVTMSRYAVRTRSSSPRLRAGDELTVEDLLHLALMKSTNSAAVALAEAAAGSEKDFVELMNRKAEEIGAIDTHFENASGLPEGGKQHTTAMDLTIILKKAITYPLIREIIGKKQTVIETTEGRRFSIGNTVALLWYRDDMVGGKTGFTNRAQHCFVGAIETARGLVYTVVLGAPSRSRLWKSTAMLADLSANPEQASWISAEEQPTAKVRKRKQPRYRKTKR